MTKRIAMLSIVWLMVWLIACQATNSPVDMHKTSDITHTTTQPVIKSTTTRQPQQDPKEETSPPVTKPRGTFDPRSINDEDKRSDTNGPIYMPDGSSPSMEALEDQTPFFVPIDPLFVMPEPSQRPVAVVIDNQGSVPLPQGGVGLSQIVYEITVEGGITRLMQVYWGLDVDLIGPVRSVRHYYIDYMKEHDAFFVIFGWSPQARRDLLNQNIQMANGVYNAGSIFWNLTNDPGNWQDSYTSTERIERIMDFYKYPKTTEVDGSDLFSKNWIVPEGEHCDILHVVYNSAYRVHYEYDKESGLYNRFRQGAPYIERNNEQQVQAGNIVIQFVKNERIPGDTEDRQSLETVGQGKGYWVTAGKIVPIYWSKPSRYEKTEWTDEQGQKIVFNPARTWIQIVPLHARISWE